VSALSFAHVADLLLEKVHEHEKLFDCGELDVARVALSGSDDELLLEKVENGAW